MGTYSWTCAKTNLPILGSESWGRVGPSGHDFGDFTQVVLLHPDEGIVAYGTYYGYGQLEVDGSKPNRGIGYVSELEFSEDGTTEAIASGRAKLALASHYDPAKDTFESLGRSRTDPGQGHFHDEDFILRCREAGGFASYDGYHLAYHKSLDFDAATRITKEQAKLVIAARRSLSEALHRAREEHVLGRMDRIGEAADHHRPTGFTLVPVDGSLDLLSVLSKKQPGAELARIDLTAEARGEDTFGPAARAIVESVEARRASKAVFERDGNILMEAELFETDLGETWYEVVADGVRQAFRSGHGILEHLGIEASRDYLDVLYPHEPIPEPVTFQVPQPEDVPGLA